MFKPSFIIAIIVTLFLASCQPSPKERGQKLRINLLEEPQTLDPRRVRDFKDQTLMRMLFEGLMRVGPEERAELALAKEIEISPDLKTYIFHLRKAVWTNGDPVTAGDFAYAWKQSLDPSFPSENAFQLYVIKNAKAAKLGQVPLEAVAVWAQSPETLKVELEQPTPYFLELVTTPCFFPVNQKVDQADPRWMQNVKTYVSNGPFELVEFRHQDQIRVQKSGSFWDKQAVRLQEIEIAMVREETEFKMFEKSELDWAGSPLSSLPVDALKELKQAGALETKSILGTYFLRANVEKPPFNHPWIRWAFALAINRKAIVEHITQGNQIPATGLVPVSLQLQKEPYFRDGDMQMASDLFSAALKELGLRRDQLPEITLTYAANERGHLIAQALQQQWLQAFGLPIRVESVEKKISYDRLAKHDYQLAISSWLADFNDPINFLEIFKHKTASTNNTQWENPHFVELLDRSMTLLDPEERRAILSQSERLLIDEMPIIPIFHYTLLYLKNQALKDVVLTNMGTIDFKWAHFEERANTTKIYNGFEKLEK